MSAHTLLIELVTEELPPKALRRLGEAFAISIVESRCPETFMTSSMRPSSQ